MCFNQFRKNTWYIRLVKLSALPIVPNINRSTTMNVETLWVKYDCIGRCLLFPYPLLHSYTTPFPRPSFLPFTQIIVRGVDTNWERPHKMLKYKNMSTFMNSNLHLSRQTFKCGTKSWCKKIKSVKNNSINQKHWHMLLTLFRKN